MATSMKTYFYKNLNRFKYILKKSFRDIKTSYYSVYTTYLTALILGLTIGIAPFLIFPTLIFLYKLRFKKKRVVYTSALLIFSAIVYTSTFMYNIANLDTNVNSIDLVIISKYKDYYEGYSIDSNIIVQIYTRQELNLFSRVIAEGELKTNKTNPYYSISRNTPFNIQPSNIRQITLGVPLILQLKEYMTKNLDYNLSEESSDFAKSLLFGDSSYVDKDVKEDFKQIGILHVIALSGYNFILILNLVNSCLFFIDKRKRGLITIPIGIIYLLIAGLTNLSGLRALIFFIITTLLNYFGIYISRTKLILTTVVFFLLINPLNIYSFSLVLSYSAYLGIIFASEIQGNRIKKLVSEQVIVSLFTLPTLALISSSFNILSLVINILLSPVVSLVSVLLVIAQVTTPILSFTNVLIELILKLTSKLSEIALQTNAILFMISSLVIMYIISKITKLIIL
jgi:competence protein ComEC